MTIFEYLYYLGFLIKKYLALKNQKKLPCKVISIGNITVGGTGKTPAAIALAEEAKNRGLRPCILTRGYRGRAKGPCFVQDIGYKTNPPKSPFNKGGFEGDFKGGMGGFREIKKSCILFGDEPVLMAERLQDVPIVKCADRYKGGIFAIQNLTLNQVQGKIQNSKSQILFILDDGFQHLGLFRDKDILLIDGTKPFGNRRLLPLGPLREPLGAISRADIIVITKTEHREQSTEHRSKNSRFKIQDSRFKIQDSKFKNLIEEIKRYNSRASIFFAEHSHSKFVTITGNTLPLEWAKEKRFFGFCGIGNPESFRRTLLSAGIELTGFKTYRDHYIYNSKDIEAIIKNAKKSGANWIVTTEKDIMRLKGLEVPQNLVALAIEFSVDEGFYEEVFRW